MDRPTRRSSTRRTVPRKYTEDVLGIEGLNNSDVEDETPRARKTAKSDESDEEFVVDEGPESLTGGVADDQASNDELGSVTGSMIDDDKIEEIQKQQLEGLAQQHKTHSRGILRPSAHSAKYIQLRLAFGCTNADLLPVVDTRDLWSGSLDTTLPSRETLQRAWAWYVNGNRSVLGIDANNLKNESTKGWEWYHDEGIGGRFRKKQNLEPIGEEEGQRYLPTHKRAKTTVLVGPVGAQKDYSLGRGESFDFGSAWSSVKPKSAKNERQKKTKDAKSDPNDSKGSSAPTKPREGWILNLGNKVQCISWAPNCNGKSQYLAVSTPVLNSQKASIGENESKRAPAFTPSPPYPGAIQIWSFAAGEEIDGVRRLDMSVDPRLRMVICTDAGDIKRFQWCTMISSTVSSAYEGAETVNLGLLAGIWGDGSVKIFNIEFSKMDEGPEYVKMERPAMQIKPPSTVCTCLAWLSPSDIAVGCANGFVGLWSLSATACNEAGQNPEPYMYIPIHETYVLNVVSAYPTFPHLLTATAVDGQTRLFSLLDPAADTTDAKRIRMGTYNLAYSPFLRSFITSDEADYVRLLPIRRFFTAISSLKSNSIITALAPSSLHHPCIVAGNAGGTVVATNSLRKLIHSKEKQWQQVWFSHEWVRGKGDDSNTDRAGGTSRFFDGFKAELSKLSKSAPGEMANGQAANPTASTTIYEEETAITAIVWNQNAHCAGWACVGLGSGLVRVEDLAHE